MTRCNNRDVANKKWEKGLQWLLPAEIYRIIDLQISFFLMSGVLMLLCVWQQDDSSADHDDEEASERVSLRLYAHFVSFIDCIF